MEPEDVYYANAVTSLIYEDDRRSTDGVSSRCAFHDFIGQEIQKRDPILNIDKLADGLDEISRDRAPWVAHHIATWVARCVVFDGASEQEPFFARLGSLIHRGPEGHEALAAWAKAASWLNDEQRAPLPISPWTDELGRRDWEGEAAWRAYRPKADWERWRGKVDYSELARILLTFAPEHMQPAAELYYNHLAPRLSHRPRMHGELLRAIRELPPELYLAEDTMAPEVLRRLGDFWFEAPSEERATILRSCQWAAGWLLPESRQTVLAAMARAFEDNRGRRTAPLEPPPSLARVAALFALLPTHLVVDIARVEVARRATSSPEEMAARAEAFIFPLQEEEYVRAWADHPDRLWEAVMESQHLTSISDLEAYMAASAVPPEAR